ncbi:interferon gamma receptor 1 [Cyrtonyx montezumae]|uniref:interferon gamma receptor 1 n=1 Tax=Cyrtonyx montezumae TaxID=9017 RepID=UPI0032D9F1D0
MCETPRFVVEVKPYYIGHYKIVSACVNISATSCDLSREIEDIFSSYWFRIKAFVGSQQSEYVETDEFVLQKHGKIGPPKLNLSRHSAEIMVDIYHPELPSVEAQPCIKGIYSQLSYVVIFRNSKNESRKEFAVADCEMGGCSLNIPVPSEGSKYCVSAKGYFYDNLLVGAQSEESCIWVPPEQTWGTQVTTVVFTIILTVGLVLSMCYGCKKLRRKNIKLPKSLASMIRSLNADNSYESRSEAKDICAVTIVPVPAVSVPSSMNDDEALLNVESEEEAVTPENLTEGTSSGPLPEASGKVEETSVPENTGVPSDVDQNHKEKEMNFVLDSSQTDVCSNSSGPVVSAMDIRQEVIPSSCPKFSGYDKPHVPLDMLIDVGEEQPVIAYRSTE